MNLKFAAAFVVAFSAFSAWAGDAAATEADRYQITTVTGPEPMTFMVDRKTGKIWHAACLVDDRTNGGCALKGWKEELVVGIDISKKEIEALRQSLANTK